MTTTISTSHPSSSDRRLTVRIAQRSGEVVVRGSTVADGDFHRTLVAIDELEPRRRALVDLPWTMLDQRHGLGVVEVRRPGEHDGVPADIAVTAIPNAVLGCWVADCAPVVAIGTDERFAIAHVGWRGLAAGALPVAAAAVAEPLAAIVLGPSIGPCCYAFGGADLARVARGVGRPMRRLAARTADGALALDVPGAIAAFAADHGVELVRIGGCTGCSDSGFSHRVRRDRERHVVAAWRQAGERV